MPSPTRYLEYLEKEMTIVGLLSAFLVAVPSVLLDRLVAAKEGELAAIWTAGKPFFVIASALSLLSAALFFKQRSLLAFYYGRIALASDSEAEAGTVKQLLDDADSWTTWIPYEAAFWVGLTAAAEFIVGSFFAPPLPRAGVPRTALGPLVFLGVVLLGILVIHTDRRVKFAENPWVGGFRRRFGKEPR